MKQIVKVRFIERRGFDNSGRFILRWENEEYIGIEINKDYFEIAKNHIKMLDK